MKRFVYINDDDLSHDLYFDNRISNRKYTLLNFLPKNLWEQFRRFMNQYFLLIACLQLWSLITPVNLASTWGPLIFIFSVSATKEALDDFNRYLSDKKANEKEVWVVKQGFKTFSQCFPSQKINGVATPGVRSDAAPTSIILLPSWKAIVVFIITIHSYAFEKSEMKEVSMVALSGCIWLQAFVVAMETNSFTILQHLAIWGNIAAFYVINLIVSAIPRSGMYTIMFRLCRQPSYWITMSEFSLLFHMFGALIVAAGMGPVLALKYFRFTYRSSKINILQQVERTGGPILSLGSIESQPRVLDVSPLPKTRNPVVEPLLSDSPNDVRWSFGQGTLFNFLQLSQSRLSSSYARNCKDN